MTCRVAPFLYYILNPFSKGCHYFNDLWSAWRLVRLFIKSGCITNLGQFSILIIHLFGYSFSFVLVSGFPCNCCCYAFFLGTYLYQSGVCWSYTFSRIVVCMWICQLSVSSTLWVYMWNWHGVDDLWRDNIARVASVGVWVKHWMQCRCWAVSILHCASLEVDMPFIRYFK